jgi:ribonuclease-3
MIVADELMRGDPDADEGVLSKARAAAVNKQALARRARSLELGRHLRLGRGEQRSGGADKDSILANVFEALIGAIYLDGGLEPARGFVLRELGPGLSDSDAALGDAKTRLQEHAQGLGLAPPSYRIVEESGPDHAKRFCVEVCLAEDVLGRGRGTSKQAAEQDAARVALAVVQERSA